MINSTQSQVKSWLILNMLKVAVILSDVKLQISFNVKELWYRHYLTNKFTIQCIHTHTHTPKLTKIKC